MRRPDQHELIAEARALLRWTRRRWWLVWLVAAALSIFVQSAMNSPRPHQQASDIDPRSGTWQVIKPVAAMNPDHPQTLPVRLSALVWPERSSGPQVIVGHGLPQPGKHGREPVVLLHGSPGQASDLRLVAREVLKGDRRVFAIDLPGFGDSAPSPTGYSIRAHASYVIPFLDKLGVRRFHLVGWSMGGGVALNVIDLLGEQAGSRVASLTLMASIGVQEGEGSGSYHFEHFKYAAGFAGLVALPELIPHFGLLGDRHARYAFIRNFWDTDQRPLRAIMQHTRVPTLILHGRHDSLIPAWVAEESHRLIPASRLVMIDANHFLPFLQAGETARILEEHFARHDPPGGEPRTDAIDLAPAEPARTPVTRALAWSEPLLRAAPWWAELAAIALLALLCPVAACVAGTILAAHQQLDLFLVGTGIALGWTAQVVGPWILGFWRGTRAHDLPLFGPRLPRISPEDWRRRLDSRPFRAGWQDHFVPSRRVRAFFAAGVLRRAPAPLVAGRALAIIACALVATLIPFILFTLASRAAADRPPLGTNGWIEFAIIAAVAVAAWVLTRALSRPGRQNALAALTRLARAEFWPVWFFYAPLYAYLVPLSVRHRGLMTPSCCNPGIEAGGGVVGESKHAITRALLDGAPAQARDFVLPARLVEAGADPALRAHRVEQLVAEHALAYPLILKPDEGQRGHAVRLIRSANDARAYFQDMHRDAVLQPYHPGPCECGILWARLPRRETNAIPWVPPSRGRAGFIFSITRKEFPVITGDGRRTLEELIDAHPRFRCQSAVHLERFADTASRVLAEGEPLRLAVSGNHCQGTLFRDGADLITPELEDAIDRLAAAFPGPDGQPGGLDFGRFDARYTSDDDLRAGRGFAVVELNGTFSESTNLYDPSKSLVWSYSVLFRQWKLMYVLGEERLREGARPMTIRQVLSAARDHFAARDGSAVAD